MRMIPPPPLPPINVQIQLLRIKTFFPKAVLFELNIYNFLFLLFSIFFQLLGIFGLLFSSLLLSSLLFFFGSQYP